LDSAASRSRAGSPST
jgi:glycyl-tRNA synthetase beta chain